MAQIANFVGPSSGGLRVVVEELGQAQLRAGRARLLILPARANSRTADGRDQRLTVASPPLPRSNGRYRVLLRRRPVVEALEAFGPDVVEVHDQTTLAWVADWARGHGVRSILFCHERLDLALAEASRLPADWLGRRSRVWSAGLAGRFDTVVCASAFAAEPFSTLASAPLHVVPFGVDLDTFSPATHAAGDRPPADEAWDFGPPAERDAGWRLMFAGRLHPEKAPGVAFDVLDILRAAGDRARLLVVGGGPLETALRRRSARDRLPVRFLGHVSGRAELAALFGSADVVLAPGPRETFGLGMLEAMACGTPVAVSSHGASRELLSAGAGGAAATSPELAEIVRRMVADPLRHAEHRGAARGRAEQFPWSKTVTTLERIAYAPALGVDTSAVRGRRKVQNR